MAGSRNGTLSGPAKVSEAWPAGAPPEHFVALLGSRICTVRGQRRGRKALAFRARDHRLERRSVSPKAQVKTPFHFEIPQAG